MHNYVNHVHRNKISLVILNHGPGGRRPGGLENLNITFFFCRGLFLIIEMVILDPVFCIFAFCIPKSVFFFFFFLFFLYI